MTEEQAKTVNDFKKTLDSIIVENAVYEKENKALRGAISRRNIKAENRIERLKIHIQKQEKQNKELRVLLPKEEMIEPIQNALYSTCRLTPDQCNVIADGILSYLNEVGYKIVRKAGE